MSSAARRSVCAGRMTPCGHRGKNKSDTNSKRKKKKEDIFRYKYCLSKSCLSDKPACAMWGDCQGLSHHIFCRWSAVWHLRRTSPVTRLKQSANGWKRLGNHQLIPNCSVINHEVRGIKFHEWMNETQFVKILSIYLICKAKANKRLLERREVTLMSIQAEIK